jgi:hypothetical protein
MNRRDVKAKMKFFRTNLFGFVLVLVFTESMKRKIFSWTSELLRDRLAQGNGG